MLPMIVVGTALGVILNKTMPELLVTICLVAVYVQIIVLTIKKLRNLLKQEVSTVENLNIFNESNDSQLSFSNFNSNDSSPIK